MNSHHGSRGAATPLDEAKVRLRTSMRAERRRLSAGDPNAAESLARRGLERLLALSPDPGVVAGYNPQGAEIDPAPLLEALRAAGWTLALPRAVDRSAPLEFRDADAPMTRDAFEIPAPADVAQRLTPDLVLVPVLAFDGRGGRLGQGAGCYDRTLAALRAAGRVVCVGLAFAGQAVERVPVEAHDVPLDLILTERGPVDVLRGAR